jgi:chorismate dehydratase
MSALRVAGVDFLNALPLVEGLGPPEFELSLCVPSRAADDLARGRVDAALLPVAELTRIPGLAVIPGVAIAARGAVDSVLLLSNGPPEALTTLHPDPASRTSNILARLLLRLRWGCDPAVHRGPAPTCLESGHGRVLIGDAALDLDRARLRPAVWDLAQVWFEHTGRPFVFAVWALASGRGTPQVCRALLEARRRGQATLERIARSEGPKRGIEAERALRYLRRRIHYELGAGEIAALQSFLDLAAAEGLLPLRAPLQILGD